MSRPTRTQRLYEQFYPNMPHLGQPVLEAYGNSPWLNPADARPRDELHGLSPAQLRALFEGDWDRRGPLRLNDDLTLDEARRAPLFANVHFLLVNLADAGTVRAYHHQFDPKFGAVLLFGLPHFAEFREEYRAKYGDAVTETDIPAIGMLRKTTQRLGLVRCNRRGFSLTPLGAELAEPAHGGRLYALLLRAAMMNEHVRELVFFLSPADGALGLIRGWAFPLWALGHLDRRWRTPQEFALALAPPWVWEQPWAKSTGELDFTELVGDTISVGFEHPLVQLGLIEERVDDEDDLIAGTKVRRAPLYHRALRFDFGPDGPTLPADLQLVD